MTIVTKISEILKSSTHLSEMEEAITAVMRDMTSTILSDRLEALDKELIQPYLSEGWAIDRREERQLTFTFGTFGTSRDLFQLISDYLTEYYDLSETLIIANSDGGAGYESFQFESILGRHRQFEYCLDSYHIMRQITGKLGFNNSLQAAVRQAVKAYDVETVKLLLDTEESLLEDEKQLERLERLRSYLVRHWEAIKPLSERGLSVSSGVGVCESGHRFYTNRMKRQGRNWRQKGAEHMSILLTALRNHDFKDRYRASHQEVLFGSEIRVNMRQILKKTNHDAHPIPQAKIALNGATSTAIGQLKKWIEDF